MKNFIPSSPFVVSIRTAVSMVLISGLPFLAQAQTQWDAGGAPDLDWSNFDNWNTNASPAAQDVVFPNANKTTQNVPNNVVDTNFTIRSLNYTNTGTGASDWHVTEIGTGVTLTVNNASAPTNSLVVGGMSGGVGDRLTTLARIEGTGSLLIDQSGANVLIGNTGANSGVAANQGYATLDLSGLSSFEAIVTRFAVGLGRTSNATALLAGNSEITAGTLVVGDTAGNQIGGHSHLRLGEETRLFVDSIRIGANSASHQNLASGTVNFQEGLDTPTLQIRSSAGGDNRASLTVGDQGNDTVANASVQNAVLDLTGGEVDAKISTLNIGRGRGNSSSAGINASVSIDAGTLDATTVQVGLLGNNASVSAGATVATLNLLGGNFLATDLYVARNTQSGARQTLEGQVNIAGSAQAEVTNTIVLGQSTATTPGTVSAVLDISGGTLVAHGGIAEGTSTNPAMVTSELILRGGTLDVSGTNITVDTWNLQSGTLRNLKEFNSGAAVVKTTTGTLTVEGNNAWTGATTVSAGTLLLDGNISNTSGVTVFNDAVLGGEGTINTAAGVTVQAGGIIAPGAGLLSIGALTLEEDGGFSVSLSGSNPGEFGRLSAQSGQSR